MRISSLQVCDKALKMVGTPYVHQGRKPGVGLDCIGLPILVAKQLELGDFDEIDYQRRPDGTLKDKIRKVCIPVTIQRGTLAIFKISNVEQHCGIIFDHQTGGLGLVHAWDIADKVVAHRLGDWRKKLVGCYGLPGVRYE